MQDSIAEHRPIRAAALIALGIGGLFAGTALSACSSVGGAGDTFTFFADPGVYEYHSCDQIAGIRQYWTNLEQELKQLMDKAEKGTGGTFINVIAYQNDYVSAKEQIKVLTATARAKNCATPENWRSNSSFR
jgi:hypothetical protein